MATSVVKIDTHKFEPRESELRAIVVKDADTCAIAKRGQKDVRDELKRRHFVLDPFVAQAKIAYDNAKEERARWIDPLESLDEALAKRVKDWERAEREREEADRQREQERVRIETERKAREERQRLQREAEEERKRKAKEIEEARKAGELNKREAERLKKETEAEAARQKALALEQEKQQAANVPTVEIVSAIPTQSGVPSRINYKAEVTHPERIINAYVDAVVLRNTERAVYLRQFVMVNEQAVGAEARKVKNSKQMATLIPGVRFYED